MGCDPTTALPLVALLGLAIGGALKPFLAYPLHKGSTRTGAACAPSSLPHRSVSFGPSLRESSGVATSRGSVRPSSLPGRLPAAMPANGEPLPARHGKCGVTAGTARQSPNPIFFAGNAGNFTSRQFAVCRHASLKSTQNLMHPASPYGIVSTQVLQHAHAVYTGTSAFCVECEA